MCSGLGKEELNSSLVPLCGVISGILASLLTHPADVVKTAIQASSEPYHNITIVENIFKVKTPGYNSGKLILKLLNRSPKNSIFW